MKLIVHPLEVASVVKVEREVDDEPDAGGGDGGGDEDLPYCRPLRPVRWDERTRREPQAPTLASKVEKELYLLNMIDYASLAKMVGEVTI